jgi:hypothetical protein
MSPRETIYEALFQKAIGDESQAKVWKTTSRRLVHWSEVGNTDQPALFMTQGSQTAEFTQKMPTRWTLEATIYMYAKTGGELLVPPMQILNPLIDQFVENILPSALTGEQTLGGLVERCRIDGPIETDEGVLGDQAVVIIPVTMFLPQ